MKLFYTDIFALPLPEGHRFPMAKYTRLRQRAEAELGDRCQLVIPPAATDEQLLRVHTPQYLQAITQGNLSPLQQRRIGFPWTPEMVQRSRRSTGATIAAAQAASQEGIAVNLAGGTHHAFPDSGQGYCVFNDVCVAARDWQQARPGARVLFVDCDVHQGNGTAAIASGDPTLFSFSMHCHKNYPFQKATGDLDIGLPPGTGDGEYLQQLNRGLDRILAVFQPQLVFYLAGADPFEGDRLGQLKLTKPGLRQRDRAVIDRFRDLGTPVVVVMAGGYAPDVEDIVEIHLATVQTAADRLAIESASASLS